MNDTILVLDFGSQTNQLIARRIRELGVYSKLIHPKDIEKEDLTVVKGIILSGGPHSVYQKDAPTVTKAIYSWDIPILGICYGMQLMCHQLGGTVEASHKEFGITPIEVGSSPFLKTLPKRFNVWMSHEDSVLRLPEGFRSIAHSKTTENVIIEHQNQRWFALQYHPEVVHTDYGNEILNRFIEQTEAKRTWTMPNFIQEKTIDIRNLVKDGHVICALSGGVDSSVVAALLNHILKDQFTPIFVDHGLLRKGEREQVEHTFTQQFQMNLITVDAKELFLRKLKGIRSPEKKRKIIGHTFIEVFEDAMQKVGQANFLAQGTLYTDLIESGTKTAAKIKSHHNVGGLPKNLKLTLIEPLDTLFKDEVRALGKALGLPDSIVYRKPFPGPGIAIRILGDITEDKIRMVQESDAIFKEELIKSELDSSIWQYFTVLTNAKTVGVMGDKRTYDYVLALRAVTSLDGMTADFAQIPYPVLQKISTRITNEVPGINRVCYDITSKPPGTIEWE